jgi:hypothetical protein
MFRQSSTIAYGKGIVFHYDIFSVDELDGLLCWSGTATIGFHENNSKDRI